MKSSPGNVNYLRQSDCLVYGATETIDYYDTGIPILPVVRQQQHFSTGFGVGTWDQQSANEALSANILALSDDLSLDDNVKKQQPQQPREDETRAQLQSKNSQMSNNSPPPATAAVTLNENPKDVGSRVVSPGAQSSTVAETPGPVNALVRVGEKVSFSTVVEAVLIPSIAEIDAESKREIWWQGQDYVEFRKNYARFIRTPSIDDDPDWEDVPTADAVVGSPTTAELAPPPLPIGGVSSLSSDNHDGNVQDAVLLVASASVSSSPVNSAIDEKRQQLYEKAKRALHEQHMNGMQQQQHQQQLDENLYKKNGGYYYTAADYASNKNAAGGENLQKHVYDNVGHDYSYNHNYQTARSRPVYQGQHHQQSGYHHNADVRARAANERVARGSHRNACSGNLYNGGPTKFGQRAQSRSNMSGIVSYASGRNVGRGDPPAGAANPYAASEVRHAQAAATAVPAPSRYSGVHGGLRRSSGQPHEVHQRVHSGQHAVRGGVVMMPGFSMWRGPVMYAPASGAYQHSAGGVMMQ